MIGKVKKADQIITVTDYRSQYVLKSDLKKMSKNMKL